MKPRFFVGSVLFFFGCFATLAGDFGIQSSSRMGEIVWSGAYTAGVCTVETAPTPGGRVRTPPRELMWEVISAARALGFHLAEELVDKQIERTRAMGAYKASTLIDFERHLPLELESLFLQPLRHARGRQTQRRDAVA